MDKLDRDLAVTFARGEQVYRRETLARIEQAQAARRGRGMSVPLKSPVTKAFDGEARIIIPVFDNDGVLCNGVAANLRSRLIDQFGGYTETEAFGGYWEGIRLQSERVRVFDIACDGGVETYSTLIALASWLAREARQDCIYLRMTSGIVYLVDGSAK